MSDVPPAVVDEVAVHAVHPKRDTVSVTVPAVQARQVPGTQGDAVKVVQSLPGVARPAFGTGELVVWGSAPQDTRVYVDGVPIPALYHGGGVRSVISTDLVRGIQLVPGAYGPAYGNGLGGVLLVETRALPQEGVHGYVGADTLDASAMTSAALGPSARVAVAGRYGYLDRLLPLVTSRDTGAYVPVPRYRDYQAKATFELGPGEEVSVVLLGSGDYLTRTIPSPDPAANRSETTSSGFHRVYARYKHLVEDGSTVELTPMAGYDTSNLSTAFGGQPTHLDVSAARYGLRGAYSTRLFPAVTFTTGVDAFGTVSSVSRAGSGSAI